jgi:hypothetical protein
MLVFVCTFIFINGAAVQSAESHDLLAFTHCMQQHVLNTHASQLLKPLEHGSYNKRTSPLLVLILRTPAAPGTLLLASAEEEPAAAPQLETGRTGAEDGRAGNSADTKKTISNLQ